MDLRRLVEIVKTMTALLRRYVRSVLREERAQGPASGHLGRFVFADQRDDVPPEPNTPEEDKIATALDQHYHGRPAALEGWIDELLAHKDDYPQFFAPPGRYKNAYRTLTVPESAFSDIMGREPTAADKDGEVHVDQGTSVGPFGGRRFFSWTLDPGIFFGLKKDWGSLYSTDWVKKKVGQSGFVMFLSAPVDSNQFVLNPLKIKKTDLGGEFAYQMEVLGVDDISLGDVSYFHFTDKSTAETEHELIKDAVEAIRN